MKRAIAALFVLALAGCSNGTSTPTTTKSPEHTVIAGVDAIVRGRQSVSGTTVAITIKDNYFQPNLLTAAAGTTITFDLTNAGAGLHNFSVTAQSIDNDVTPGSSAQLKVTVPASGRLVFFCKYHRDESGMIGALDVA